MPYGLSRLPYSLQQSISPDFSAAHRRRIYNIQAADIQQPVYNSPNFVGRFNSPVYKRVRFLHEDATGLSSSAIEVANPHFIGKFYPAVYYQKFRYSTEDATGLSSDPAEAANPHWIGRFAPVQYKQFLYQTEDPTGLSSDPTTVANPHWIGRFTPVRYWLAAPSFAPPDVPPQPETNPHWIGRFQKPVYWSLGPPDSSWRFSGLAGQTELDIVTNIPPLQAYSIPFGTLPQPIVLSYSAGYSMKWGFVPRIFTLFRRK